MKLRTITATVALAVGAGILAFGWSRWSHHDATRPPVVTVDADPLLQTMKDSPKEFVARNEMSNDKQVQTVVTRARMTAAFNDAEKGDYSSARAEFLNASLKHKGSDAMNPDFGTLPEQAAYQAIVCLEAEGKKVEAAAEYRKFMRERQLSPLIHACFRRLEHLNGDKVDSRDEAALQDAVDAQEKEIRFQTSVCGPKCLEKILPLLGKDPVGYRELAKLCRTTDQGTTLADLKSACESLGLKPVGFELNAKDFTELKNPFIWLQADHYVAVLGFKNGKAIVYNPIYKTEEERPLPKADDSNFRATVLAFEIPTIDLVSDVKQAPVVASKKS
ncbi:MAG: hypothetical protein JST12_01520 [Armatimonadetes bacterium]|nr:hypothetical protein [Armatimonadota bacterium]